ILDITSDYSQIPKGATVTFKIYTDLNAERVECVYDGITVPAQNTEITLSRQAVWEVICLPSSTQVIYFNAYTAGSAGASFTQSKSMTVLPYEPEPPVVIDSIRSANNSGRNSGTVTLSIRTSMEAEYVWTVYNGHKTYAQFEHARNGLRTWLVTLTSDGTGSASVYANKVDSDIYAVSTSHSMSN
ncbi:MAG: hypothetical protein LBR83_09720, partial [Clostridiales bacterium]|nr:hypothetical protein [Clostridiales bacterium]